MSAVLLRQSAGLAFPLWFRWSRDQLCHHLSLLAPSLVSSDICSQDVNLSVSAAPTPRHHTIPLLSLTVAFWLVLHGTMWIHDMFSIQRAGLTALGCIWVSLCHSGSPEAVLGHASSSQEVSILSKCLTHLWLVWELVWSPTAARIVIPFCSAALWPSLIQSRIGRGLLLDCGPWRPESLGRSVFVFFTLKTQLQGVCLLAFSFLLVSFFSFLCFFFPYNLSPIQNSTLNTISLPGNQNIIFDFSKQETFWYFNYMVLIFTFKSLFPK